MVHRYSIAPVGGAYFKPHCAVQLCAPYRGNASACQRQRARTPSPVRAQRSRCVTLDHDPGGGHLACKVSTTTIRCADLTGQLTPVGIYTQGYVRRCAPSSPWAATVAPLQGLPCACVVFALRPYRACRMLALRQLSVRFLPLLAMRLLVAMRLRCPCRGRIL